MKIQSLIIILSVVVLYQTIPSGCYWPRLPTVTRLNQFIKSIFAENGKLKRLAVADGAPGELKHPQFRQINFNNNVFINKTTSQTTVTLSLISTTVVSTSQFCAQFVNNVFGGCRRRRELVLDENQVIDANQEMEMLMLQPSTVNYRY